jgi:hypothetical protein
MSPEERRQRILELFRGLSEQELNEMLAHVRGDIAAEAERRAHVGALLEERAGLVARGEPGDVAALDAQLAHYGYEGSKR